MVLDLVHRGVLPEGDFADEPFRVLGIDLWGKGSEREEKAKAVPVEEQGRVGFSGRTNGGKTRNSFQIPLLTVEC